jgi:flagellar biosynthesis/type III secretory pathway protein FliH
MSNVIKLGNKNRLNVRISGSVNSLGEETESEEEYLQRIEEEKQEQIFNAGREDAIKEMQAHFSRELQNKYNEYDNLMNSVNERLIEYKDSFDKIVLDVSFLISSKIIKKEISESPIIIDTIKDATSKIIGANSIVLRLNPKDKELIEESNENFLDSKSYSNIKYEIDERIEAGGCFIESEIGNVDARIASQLNALKSKLEQEILEEVN